MNIIKNRSSILAQPMAEKTKLLSYKNIFNKNILWVKLYDNYLYLYLNKNTNNKFNIFEPKTKINTSFTTLKQLGWGDKAKPNPNAALVVAQLSPENLENQTLVKKTDDNKIQINKNTIKLLNLNNNNLQSVQWTAPNSLGDLGLGSSPNLKPQVQKEIKLYKYINSIFEYKNELVKYQNIVYQFNKNNKVKQNSSVGINKNVFTLLESTFLSMSSLISKPIIIITPNKVVIQLFYYLNKYNANSVGLDQRSTNPTNNKLLNLNNDKLQSLCLNLSKIYQKPVELELDRLHYPYYDSNILSNMIGLISNIVKLRFIIKKLFTIAKIKKTNNFSNKYSILPSYLSGFKIRVAGRLLTQRVIPRLTVKTIQRGTLARGKAQFVDSARFSNKNKRGSFSITVTMGHVFF
jgi:Mitochondrial ribosomal protein (VAR1)